MRTNFRTTGLMLALATLAACNGDGSTAPDVSPTSVAAVQADVQSVSAASASDAIDAIGSGLASAGVSSLVAPSGSADLAMAATAGNCSFSAGTGFYTCTSNNERGFSVTRKFKLFSAGGAGSVADSTLAIWTTSGRDTSSGEGRQRIRIVNRADTNMSVIARDSAPPRAPNRFTNNGHGTQQDSVIYSDSNGVKTYVVNNDVRTADVVRRAPESVNPFPASGTITITLSGTMRYVPRGNGDAAAVTRSVAGTAVITFNGTQNAVFAMGGKRCALNLVTRKVSGCQ